MAARYALTALLACASAVAQDAQEPATAAEPATAVVSSSKHFEPMDVFALSWADNPRISPDGSRIVYERSFFDTMKDVRRSNLWLVDVASGDSRALTTGSVTDGAVAWSPDGRRIAYVSRDGERSQIFVRWIDGGTTARVTQLTNSPSNLSWSHDGKWLAFTMLVPAKTEPLARMPEPPEGAEWAKPARLVDRVLYRFDGSGYLEPGHEHVFVVASDGGAIRQVTRGERNHDGKPSWTRDGKALILSANLDDDWQYSPLDSELYRIDLASGAATRLTKRKGPDASPVLSPDGTRVAYLGFDDRKLGNQNDRLYVLDLESGESRVVTADFDFTIEGPAWDGNAGVFFHYDDRGETKIGRVDARGGAVRTVATDFGGTAMGRPYGGGSMSAAAGTVAYTRGTPYRPAEVAIARGGKLRQLTDLNANLLGHKQLGRVEPITYRSSADGREIQGWLVYPPGFDSSRKYPLMLEIHGGPFANYGPRFAPETQLYAAAGYVVLYVNPRGSTSYGEDFANLIHHNYPSQDYDDLMSGVDAAIARGFIDERNLFVTGGSGGGVLTAWIVGHTDRFRAAVVAKPVINWYSFVLTADYYNLFSDYWFPGRPWEHAEHYLKRSPITYVGNVKTPTMLITGESDYRTPSSEAEQFYQALKLRRIDTAMLRIPGASHSINARPSQMLAQVLHTIAWCERYRVR